MRAVVLSETVDLASSVEDVWPLLADTNRVNRAIGLSAMAFKPSEDDHAGARLVGETSVFGLTVRFDEFPFEWSWGKALRVVRRARGSPIDTVVSSCKLEPVPPPEGAGKGDRAGTRVTVRMDVTPRWGAFRPAAWLFAKKSLKSMVVLCKALDAHVIEHSSSPYDVRESEPNEELVAAAVTELKKSGVVPELADKLGAFVKEAPDFELVRIRPFELAARWEAEKREVLRVLLHAVPAGLVELKWAIVCPSCRTASDEANALDQISLEGHCHLCDISFELDLDRAVEATFVPHPSARPVSAQMFCSGGPARVPHVLAQVVLEPGEVKALEVPPAAGRYRIFARGGASASVEVAVGTPEKREATVEDGKVTPVDLRVSPRGAIDTKNATSETRHVKLERLGYATEAATAHFVSTMPEFRSLFSSDLLKASTPLKVSRAAILFSDLTGSTALYSKVGDAAAFRLVDDHFDVIRDAVKGHGGAFVKTMGDAVMAAFVDVASCARAAIDALERFETFRMKQAHGASVGIKLGINAGPCYIVTANGALDYFGQTVNVASRVQHLAAAGELVLAKEVFDSLPDAERQRVVASEPFAARVKGVESPLSLVRLRVR
jgi:adenylate cyclase